MAWPNFISAQMNLQAKPPKWHGRNTIADSLKNEREAQKTAQIPSKSGRVLPSNNKICRRREPPCGTGYRKRRSKTHRLNANAINLVRKATHKAKVTTRGARLTESATASTS